MLRMAAAVLIKTYELTSRSPGLKYPLLTLLQSSTGTSTSGGADRNPDGTFTKGSDAAKELGAKGGHASHGGGASGEVSPSTRSGLLDTPRSIFPSSHRILLLQGHH
jgi:hypothetical protein